MKRGTLHTGNVTLQRNGFALHNIAIEGRPILLD